MSCAQVFLSRPPELGNAFNARFFVQDEQFLDPASEDRRLFAAINFCSSYFLVPTVPSETKLEFKAVYKQRPCVSLFLYLGQGGTKSSVRTCTASAQPGNSFVVPLPALPFSFPLFSPFLCSMSVQEILLLFLSQLFLPNLNWFNLVDNQHVLKHQGFNYFSVCTENTIGIGTNQCENIILEITLARHL